MISLYALLNLVENDKLEEILPLIHSNKPDDYVQTGDDYFGESTISQIVCELRSENTTKEMIIPLLGKMIKWITLHSEVGA